MSVINRLSHYIITKPKTLSGLVAVLAVFGSVIILSGGIWDAISHIMQEPEYFWTIQHISVYFGVGMISSAAIVGSVLLTKNYASKTLRAGIKVIIIGSIIQIVSGFADSISHDVFGIDGLVSLSHQPLEFGLMLNTIGGFLIIKSMNDTKFGKLLPAIILALIASIMWLGFNLILPLGNVVMCIPIYEIFSSGCAIL